MTQSNSRLSRVLGVVRQRGTILWVVAVVAAIALGTLFGSWAFGAPRLDQTADAAATVDVATMTVGRSIPLAVSATWTARPFGVGAASGVLTSVDIADGAEAAVGARLYTVDLRPVVAGVGAVPAFRDLSQGSRGADVVQLEQLLVSTGFLASDANDTFGRDTTAAVRAWQASLGVAKDGVVRASDIVYASTLPARVQLSDEVAVGARLVPGDIVLSVLDGAPQFIATVPSGSTVDATLPIEVTFADASVGVVVAESRYDTSGNTLLVLTRADGTPVCADLCDTVPLDPRDAVYPTRQIITPEVTGPGVPAAALWFGADGDPYVVLDDGTHVAVTILGQGQGAVVIDGVAVGTTVVLAGVAASP